MTGSRIERSRRARQRKGSNIERIHRFTVADNPFTAANEMMTLSMTIRRHVIVAKYGKQLEALYRA